MKFAHKQMTVSRGCCENRELSRRWICSSRFGSRRMGGNAAILIKGGLHVSKHFSVLKRG